MKQIILGVLISMFTLTGNASTLAKGERFDCALLTAAEENSVVACHVIGDVYSYFDKTLAIPAASRMAGKMVDGQVVLNNWVTPQGLVVKIPPNTLATKFMHGNNVVSITALKDLGIQ